MTSIRAGFACLIVLSILTVRGFAQAAAQPAQPPADPLDELRAKSILTDEDRQALRTWITQRVEAIVSGSGASDSFTQLHGATTQGSAAFKDTFSAVTIELSKPLISRAPLAASAQLLTLLSAFDRIEALEVFIEALSDERAAVRTAAAVGLGALRGKIVAGGGPAFSRTVEALQKAGERETSAEALKAVYRALDYSKGSPAAPDPAALAAALLSVLNAQTQRYSTPETATEGAEPTGLKLGAALLPRFSDEQKQAYVIVLARVLRHMVLRYSTELYLIQDNVSSPVAIAARNNAEQAIMEAEAQLTDLLKPSPAPNVREALRGAGREVNARIELNKWADLLETATGQRFHAEPGDGG